MEQGGAERVRMAGTRWSHGQGEGTESENGRGQTENWYVWDGEARSFVGLTSQKQEQLDINRIGK